MVGSSVGLQGACLAVAWLLGVAVHLRQATLADGRVHLALLLLSVVLLACGVRMRRIRLPASVLAVALAAFAMSGMHAQARLAQRLAASLEGRDITVTGLVSNLPQRGADGWRFRFDVQDADVPLPQTLSLGWYAGEIDEPQLRGAQAGLRAGQRWRFTVRLKRPHGSLNPHGFDAELWMFEQGIGATGYVRDTRDTPARLLDEYAGAPLERLRQRVRDGLSSAVEDGRAAGVLTALSVGEQAAIDRDDWDLFRQTGVAHLMSISGLHITMFAWLAGVLLRALWRCSDALMLRIAAPVAARWGGVCAAAAYALFSGWGVPSQRTVYMLACVALLKQLGVSWPWPLLLLSAAVVVTAIDPWALLQAGFWLSFVAVGVLMLSAPAEEAAERAGLRRILREALRTQVLATVGLTPLSLVIFQQLSIVGFAANLVAIPLVTLIITPLALLGCAWSPLWLLGAQMVHALNAWLAWLLALPGAVLIAPVAPVWAQGAGLMAGALAVAPLPRRWRALSALLVLPLLWPPVSSPPPGRFELIAVDVGQGTAVLLRTSHHALLYDSGPQYGRESDAGQRVLLPLLRALGTVRLQRLVLSHRDADHVGGAAALLQGLQVEELLSSLEDEHPLLALAAQRGANVQRCVDGQSWTMDGVRFSVLRPDGGDYARKLKSNAMSCVLHVQGDEQSALLGGDMEAEQERDLVQRHGAELRSDLLLVPHHGSRTSSTPELLDAVRPRVAVVQAGYRNRFGHPAADVMQRYDDRHIAVERSDRCGAWWWQADGTMSCERAARPRYWHWRP